MHKPPDQFSIFSISNKLLVIKKIISIAKNM